MQVGTVLRHLTNKTLIVLVVHSGKSTIEVKVINQEKPDWFLNTYHNATNFKIKLSRLERTWKVDKVGTVLYGRK